jgi:hypothetical protein
MSLVAAIPVIGKIIDKIFPDKQAAAEAKLKLFELQQKGDLKELDTAANIIIAEASGEGILQRNWRPITMLTFVGLIVAHWLGFTAENLTEVQIMGLLDIVKLGIGGYVLGRSAEKIADNYKKKE